MLHAPGYSPQDLWAKGSREYGVLSQKQDGVALRAEVPLSGLLKHFCGYWHDFEATLNISNVFKITKQACPFSKIPPLWSPKDFYTVQTPQHCGSTISFLSPTPQCPKCLFIDTGPLKRRLTGNEEYFFFSCGDLCYF